MGADLCKGWVGLKLKYSVFCKDEFERAKLHLEAQKGLRSVLYFRLWHHPHLLSLHPMPSTESPLLACYDPHMLSPSRASPQDPGAGTSKPLGKDWRGKISDFEGHTVPVAPPWLSLHNKLRVTSFSVSYSLLTLPFTSNCRVDITNTNCMKLKAVRLDISFNFQASINTEPVLTHPEKPLQPHPCSLISTGHWTTQPTNSSSREFLIFCSWCFECKEFIDYSHLFVLWPSLLSGIWKELYKCL